MINVAYLCIILYFFFCKTIYSKHLNKFKLHHLYMYVYLCVWINLYNKNINKRPKFWNNFLQFLQILRNLDSRDLKTIEELPFFGTSYRIPNGAVHPAPLGNLIYAFLKATIFVISHNNQFFLFPGCLKGKI